MSKRALILGINGQDGSFLAELLLERGYEVHGLYRRSSIDNLRRIQHIRNRISLHQGDVTDFGSLLTTVAESDPQFILNLADQDSISWSKSIPSFSWNVTSAGPLRLLEVVRAFNQKIRLFQPLSCTMFGDAPPPQNEDTPLAPASPFACAKAAAWHLCKHYRREHGLHVSCGIMFNHDSPSRSEDYVLHKICKAAVNIAHGNQESLTLGNLDQTIDIGYARDYMLAAWKMLQQPTADDWCIGTGRAISIRDMAKEAFARVGLTWEHHVRIDPSLQHSKASYRADNSKARSWWTEPITPVEELIGMIVEHYEGVIK